MPHRSSASTRCRRFFSVSALALLVASSAACVRSDRYRVVCIEQNYETLEEIASGSLDRHNPHVAAWERQVAALCGWVTEEDFNAGND